MASILWSGPENTMIRTTLDDAGSGHRLAGTVLTIRDKVPLEIRYVILTDDEWAPRDVGIHILGGEADVRLALAADGKGSRCVVLKQRLAECSESFGLYVIAHELAHAFLHNGSWGEISDPEDAADALAESWGFPRPASWF